MIFSMESLMNLVIKYSVAVQCERKIIKQTLHAGKVFIKVTFKTKSKVFHINFAEKFSSGEKSQFGYVF